MKNKGPTGNPELGMRGFFLPQPLDNPPVMSSVPRRPQGIHRMDVLRDTALESGLPCQTLLSWGPLVLWIRASVADYIDYHQSQSTQKF